MRMVSWPWTMSLIKSSRLEIFCLLGFFVSAVQKGHKDIVKLLIANGANARDDPMLIHNVVPSGHKDVVELLFLEGADVNAKTIQGQTPLQLAQDKRHDEITELLRKHGAKE